MPAYRIQSHTRHESAQIVAGYIREADKWTKSGLDGVGFRVLPKRAGHEPERKRALYLLPRSPAPNWQT
jgi:hypothetical protein